MSDTAKDPKNQANDNLTITAKIQPPTGQIAGAIKAKELEPSLEEDKAKAKGILSEVIRASEAADEQTEKEVKSAISEARLSRPEPKLPPDVADSGVKAPQLEANKVISQGTTVELPIPEDEYKKGLHQKVVGTVVNKVVIGTSSLFALAVWIGRLIKIAHKHTMRVVFRKPSFAKASDGKEVNKDAD